MNEDVMSSNNNKKSSKEIVNIRLIGREVEMIGEYVNKDTKSLFKCDDGHIWSASPNNVIRGKGRCCPYCAGQVPLSKEIVNERINHRGISLIGKYTDTSTHTTFKCSNGHIWSAKPNNIMNGRGCPICVKSGYRPNKSGWIYIIKYNDFIKYGITNNPSQRLSKHKKWGDYETLLLKEFNDGKIAREWEHDIKNEYGGSFASRKTIGDGWTETLPILMAEKIISFTKDKYINEE